MSTQEKSLITEKEQAEQLSISWRHLQELRKKGLIPYVRLGRLVRYSPPAVWRSMERLTVEAID
jgi:excisionase family DNA binding protein